MSVEIGQVRFCRHTELWYKVMDIVNDEVDITFLGRGDVPKDDRTMFRISDIERDILATKLMEELL